MMNQIKALNQKLLYQHRMTIYRQEKVKQPDCSAKLDWVKVAEDIPCKLSQKSLDKGDDIKDDVNPIGEAFTVFCDPTVAIKAGDLLEITGVKYRAGRPFLYAAHQEINVARGDLA